VCLVADYSEIDTMGLLHKFVSLKQGEARRARNLLLTRKAPPTHVYLVVTRAGGLFLS